MANCTNLGVMKFIKNISFCILFFTSFGSQAQAITKSQWKEDIIELQKLLKEKHINLYHQTPAYLFDTEFKKLISKVDSLQDYEIILEITKLVALAKDGHTSFFPYFDQKVVKFPQYPLVFSQFEEGLFAIAVPSKFSKISGLKLLSIDGIPIYKIKEKLIPFIPRDNDAEVTYTYPDFITNAKLLYYVGIAKNQTNADFGFELNGKLFTINIDAISDSVFVNQEWYAARELLRKTASSIHPTFLFLNKFTLSNATKRETYWAKVIPENKTLYFQYLSCFDQKNRPTFLDYVRDSVFKILEKNPTYKLVIDMRYNSGGEPMTASPLIVGILERTILFQKQRPIVLVGTRTFSAAATNVMQLKRFCNAILIGQYSRAKPNSPSEGRGFELSNSKLQISISTEYLNRFPKAGGSQYMPMDKIIPIKFSDYINDIDKTFNEGINWKY